jgi:hypothetical protein
MPRYSWNTATVGVKHQSCAFGFWKYLKIVSSRTACHENIVLNILVADILFAGH